MKEGSQSGPRPRPGATRCPYCHDECAATGDECVCAECLSRHHRRCWDEGSGCSSCRGTRRLEAVAAPPRGGPQFNDAVDAWIKLGLVYNLVLTGVTVLTLGTRLLQPGLVVAVACGAIVANVCFLLGPAIELIIRRLGARDTTALRWALFASGTFLAMMLTFFCCLDGGFGPGF